MAENFFGTSPNPFHLYSYIVGQDGLTLAASGNPLPVSLNGESISVAVSVGDALGVFGVNGASIATTANPFPVSGTITTIGTLATLTNPAGVKGVDGTSIATTANPFPVSGTITTLGTLATITNAVGHKGVDGTNIATAANPIPVSGTISTVGTLATVTNPVGVKGADGSGIATITNPLSVNNVDLYKVTGTSTLKTLSVTTVSSAIGVASVGLYAGTVLPTSTCLIMFYAPSEVWITYDGTDPVVSSVGFPRSGIWYESLKGGSTELDKIKMIASGAVSVQCQPMLY